MLSKAEVIKQMITPLATTPRTQGTAYAPSNIALAKYWGKRDTELNLPQNSSLSISLNKKGATATLSLRENTHQISLNDTVIDLQSAHGKRLKNFLDLFGHHYQVTLDVNIPLAAGLASSACIFAALVLALNDLHQWRLDTQTLSILARLGSGSACRSVQQGFMLWHKGTLSTGIDSYAEALNTRWDALCIGLLIFDTHIKATSSRAGMQRTLTTSPLYSAWPATAEHTVLMLKDAIYNQDFQTFGISAEQNALCMHATMQSAWPPLIYSTEETLSTMKKIWRLRAAGLPVYFTQDAGPNLKLLFTDNVLSQIKQSFDHIDIIKPFTGEET